MIKAPDTTGAQLPRANAVVTLKNSAGVVLDTSTTGADGRYRFYNLGLGMYNVSVSRAKFTFNGATITLPATTGSARPSVKRNFNGTRTSPDAPPSAKAF